MLAAVRFHVRETTDFSPYYLLYNKVVIFPLVDILKPHLIYYGNEHLKIALWEMPEIFTLVRSNMKKSRRRATDGSLTKTKDLEFKVGDLDDYRNPHGRRKLDVRWQPYYVIVERLGPSLIESETNWPAQLKRHMPNIFNRRPLKNGKFLLQRAHYVKLYWLQQ